MVSDQLLVVVSYLYAYRAAVEYYALSKGMEVVDYSALGRPSCCRDVLLLSFFTTRLNLYLES